MAFTQLMWEACSRKEKLPVFMKGYGEDLIRLIKSFLNTVTVVSIDIDIANLESTFL